jgi:hypothetical protein
MQHRVEIAFDRPVGWQADNGNGKNRGMVNAAADQRR